MIYVPTEMSLDAASLNQGEETEREREEHVWMISHPQLPHLAVSKAPISFLQEQKEQLVRNGWTSGSQNAIVTCPA